MILPKIKAKVNRYLLNSHNTVSQSQRICFVISSPRSGSTWFKKAMNSHPEIFCTENRFFGSYADIVYDKGSSKPRVRITLDKYIESFLLHYNWQGLKISSKQAKRQLLISMIENIADLSIQLSGKTILVDKITPYVNTSELVIQSISELLPQAKVIHLVRDGRDVLTSGVFHWLTKTKLDNQNNEIIDKRKQLLTHQQVDAQLERFFTDEEIQEWCQTWVQPIYAFSSLKDNRNTLCISYEEMNRDLQPILEKVFKFLKTKSSKEILENCLKQSSFKGMSGGREKGQLDPTAHVRKGIVGDWRNYFTKTDAKLFHQLAGKELIQWGYEQDESWIEQLPDKLELGKLGQLKP